MVNPPDKAVRYYYHPHFIDEDSETQLPKVTEQLRVPGIYFPVGVESWGKIIKGENILDEKKKAQKVK